MVKRMPAVAGSSDLHVAKLNHPIVHRGDLLCIASSVHKLWQSVQPAVASPLLNVQRPQLQPARRDNVALYLQLVYQRGQESASDCLSRLLFISKTNWQS